MTVTQRGRALWPQFALLAGAIVVADQVSKTLLVGALRPGESTSVVGDLVRFVHAQNTGGLFGLFRDGAPVFAIASIGVIAMIAWYHGRSGRSPYMTLTLGLLLGGAIGNLIDRIAVGRVTDFVVWRYHEHEWPTFNVADVALCVGVGLLLLDGGKKKPPAPAKKPAR